MENIISPASKPSSKNLSIISIHISPERTAKWLLGITSILLLANIIIIISRITMEYETKLSWYFTRFFDFNLENNIPSFFSSILLILASGTLLLQYVVSKYNSELKNQNRWLILSIIFLFLAFDENIQIHEMVSEFVRPKLASDLSGLLYWSWVVPYFILFVCIAAYFCPFILNLPLKTRNLIILSGAMFVFGAIGLELFEGYFYKRYGLEHIYNQLLYCLEELLEISGVILFIYALLDHMAATGLSLVLRKES